MIHSSTRVSVFATCLVDQLFPEVGEAVVRVLRRLGIQVDFPKDQTCCGQPAFNSGYTKDARGVARHFLKTFASSEYIVVPSGSCSSMIRVFYPDLFEDDPVLQQQVRDLSARTYEFSEFLVDVLKVTNVGASYQGQVAYHPACHLVRELGVKDQPRKLLENIAGLECVPVEEESTCCGFGGTFSIKYPAISEAMLGDKLDRLVASGADTLTSCDISCLMHIRGALSRRGIPIKTMHLSQLLATSDRI